MRKTLMPTMKLEIESQLENVALVGNAISALCRSILFDEDTAYQIETCVVEAVNNAIIHAYQNQPGKKIGIEWQCNSIELIIDVKDTGITMQQIPDDSPVTLDMESGRGWYIMRQWMDEVSYRSENGNNHLILKKNCGATLNK